MSVFQWLILIPATLTYDDQLIAQIVINSISDCVGRKPMSGNSLMRRTTRRIADNAQGNVIVRFAATKIIAFTL